MIDPGEEQTMSLKKASDFRFTFKDAEGKLRVVYLQAQHFREDGLDRVRIQATTDGVECETETYIDPDLATRTVKTEELRSGS